MCEEVVLQMDDAPGTGCKGPLTPTRRLPMTSAIVCDFTNLKKTHDMMRWIGDQMLKIL